MWKSSMSSRGSFAKKSPQEDADTLKEWELRPGGMLVQKRDPNTDAAHAGPLINLKVSYGRMHHHVSITANSTFGDLKKLLVQDTGLQPKQQRLLYKGKERNDSICLRELGLKDKSKVALVEDVAGSEKRLIEMRKVEAATKACTAVADVQQLVDKLSGQVASFESSVSQGKKLKDSDLTGLIDLLMCQLLRLDESKVEGDVNVKKRILVRRVQKYVETLDVLTVKNNRLNTQPEVAKVQNYVANGHTDAAKAFMNGAKVQPAAPNTAKVQGAGRNHAANGHTDAAKAFMNVAKVQPAGHNTAMMQPAVPTGGTTVWENVGTNYHTKPPPPASEPLLIEWD